MARANIKEYITEKYGSVASLAGKLHETPDFKDKQISTVKFYLYEVVSGKRTPDEAMLKGMGKATNYDATINSYFDKSYGVKMEKPATNRNSRASGRSTGQQHESEHRGPARKRAGAAQSAGGGKDKGARENPRASKESFATAAHDLETLLGQVDGKRDEAFTQLYGIVEQHYENLRKGHEAMKKRYEEASTPDAKMAVYNELRATYSNIDAAHLQQAVPRKPPNSVKTGNGAAAESDRAGGQEQLELTG